ncbi:DUF411 domain-containing protein [Pseudorhodoplanes sinuspersici]|nr:DUF411 domain-containing protein [Pseudorhodoplanes sinuspersici]RKE66033.1 hypothetical protein DFP91_5608 [Pseudorhodoplanes sinuspersici]
MIRIFLTTLGLAGMLLATPAGAADKPGVTLYKNPQCGCCEGHANYLQQHGFKVTVVPTHDMSLIRRQHGIAERFEGCHIALVDRYVVEGHVSAPAIDKLLKEQPDIKGISLPGMPDGSPGMSGQKTEPFVTYEIGDNPSADKVFVVE